MISIITPTYNRAYLLPRMVESVLNQTYKRWELIIMDDGSTDNTKEVIEEYGDQRIKYHPTKNSGAADKRNIGVELSQNEYIIFLDSDDEVKFNWLELIVKEIKEKNAAVISCGLEKFNQNGELIETKLSFKYGGLFGNFEGLFLAGTFALKKKIFIEIGSYDKFLASGHHTDLTIRLIPHIKKNHFIYSHINISLIKIHTHSGNKIRTNNNAVFNGTMSLLKKHETLFKKNKKEHIDYLGVAAISAIKSGKLVEGKALLREAFFINPFNFKLVVRIISLELPFIRNYIWK